MTHHPHPLAPGTDRLILPDSEPQTIAEAAVALANTNGGWIVFPASAAPGALARTLAAAAERCKPAIRFGPLCPDPQPPDPAKPGTACAVERSDRVHALDDGRVVVRVGPRTRDLNGEEIRRLLSARRTGEFETECVPGATPGALDPGQLADFLAARQRDPGQAAQSTDAALHELGAFTEQAGVTVAGLLLFGRDPARWLPDAGARFVRVVGGQRVLDERIDGPLAQQFAQLWDTLHAHMRGGDRPDYPPAVLREALFNALRHRDYRLHGERLTVTLHPDRLEITSPGGLPGYLSGTQQMLGARYRRNPRLHWALAQWGLGTGSAPGILGMIMQLDQHGHRAPAIESGPYHVTLRLFRARAGQDAAPAGATSGDAQLTERQRTILNYARTRGSVTLHEIRVQCPATAPGQLQADLAALVASGHLRRIGSSSRAYYILA